MTLVYVTDSPGGFAGNVREVDVAADSVVDTIRLDYDMVQLLFTPG